MRGMSTGRLMALALLGQASVAVSESPRKKEQDDGCYLVRNPVYRMPKEPESWQGKGNRRKPKLR